MLGQTYDLAGPEVYTHTEVRTQHSQTFRVLRQNHCVCRNVQGLVHLLLTFWQMLCWPFPAQVIEYVFEKIRALNPAVMNISPAIADIIGEGIGIFPRPIINRDRVRRLASCHAHAILTPPPRSRHNCCLRRPRL